MNIVLIYVVFGALAAIACCCCAVCAVVFARQEKRQFSLVAGVTAGAIGVGLLLFSLSATITLRSE